MIIEAFFGFLLLVFVVWKYVLPNHEEPVKYSRLKLVEPDTSELNNKEAVDQISPTKISATANKQIVQNKDLKPKRIGNQQSSRPQKINYIPYQNDDLITPSILLKQRQLLKQKGTKRESPPKEKLTEFLEKTILSDDKIQSIIQNLALDKREILIHEEPAKLQYPTSKEIKPLFREQGYTLSEKVVKQHSTIDDISEQINRFKYSNLVKETKEPENYNEPVQHKVPEETPYLKRLQKHPAIPTGLNFGSVIGELKNKTKNGGLKPVFKKFEVDSINNAQAGLFFYALKSF